MRNLGGIEASSVGDRMASWRIQRDSAVIWDASPYSYSFSNDGTCSFDPHDDNNIP